MFRSAVCSLLLLSLTFTTARPLQAEGVVDQIPASSLGFVVVPNLQQASADIDATAQRMRLGQPGLLRVVKLGLGLSDGLAEQGDAAFVVVPVNGVGAPQGAILVQADYDKLTAQLNPVEHSEGISKVKLADRDHLIARKGGYAVIAPPHMEAAVKLILSSEQSVQMDEKTRAFAQRGDAYVYVGNMGVRMFTATAKGFLAQVKQQLQQAGPQMELSAAGIGIYEKLFDWAETGVKDVVVSMQVSDDGDIHIAKRVALSKPTDVGEPAGDGPRRQLAELPDWPYLVAAAGQMNESEMFDEWIRMSMDMMKSLQGAELTEEQQAKFREASRKTMQGVKGMAFTFGVPDKDQSIYGRMGLVMHVENAKAYIDNYVEGTRMTSELLGDGGALPYKIKVIEKREVAGRPGFKFQIQLQLNALLGAGAGAPQIKDLLDKMYGEGGLITVYGAAADDHRVVIGYTSIENVEKLIAAAKPGQGLTGEDVQTTSELLPQTAQVAGYFSAQGMVQYMQWVMNLASSIAPQEVVLPQFPEFDDSPPWGFAFQHTGDALEATLVAPAGNIEAIGAYIPRVRAMAPR